MERARRRIPSAVVAIATVLVGIWGFDRYRRVRTTNPTRSDGSSQAAAPTAIDPATAPETASTAAERSRDALPKSDPAEGENPPDLDFDENKVHSIDVVVILTDSHGKERRDADGEIVLVLDNKQESPREHVPVLRGRFHVDIRGPHAFGIFTALFDERPAQVLDDYYLWWHSGPICTLHARESRTVRLHVVDADSLAELTNVSIVCDESPRENPTADAASTPMGRIARSGVVSPIDLEALPDPEEVLWHPDLRATAPGYASETFGVDYRNGGEQFVALHRSASLRVHVINAPKGAFVALHETDPIDESMRDALAQDNGVEWLGQTAVVAPCQQTPDGERALIDGIPARKYLVAVESGYPNQSIALAKQEIELVVGETMNVTLTCRTTEHGAPVPIAGVIEVPAEWGDKPFELEFWPSRRPDLHAENNRRVPSSEMQVVDGNPRVFHWSAPDVVPAEYRFSIYALGANGEWEIGEKGRKDLRTVVRPCCEVAIRVVDVATGSPLDAFSLHWRSASEFGVYLERPKDSDPYVGSVPLENGTIDELGGFELVESDPLTVHAGRNEFNLHVRRLPALILDLSCDGWRVPWPGFADCGVEPVGHDGELEGDSSDDSENKLLRFSSVGRYRITLPPIFGFEPVAPFEVDIPDGKPVVRKIELKHKL